MKLNFELVDGTTLNLMTYQYGKFLMLSKNKRCETIKRVDELSDIQILNLAREMIEKDEQSRNALPAQGNIRDAAE